MVKFIGNLNFQKSLILISIVVFFISIIIVSFQLIRIYNRKEKWPPSFSKCPDYWKLVKNNDGSLYCMTDNYNIGSSSGNFNIALLPTKKDKAIFAAKYSVNWDGITNDPTIMQNLNTDPPKSIFWLFNQLFAK